MGVLSNKVSLRLINLTILMTLIYLLYKTSNLWIQLGSKVFGILLPFLISFVIAYTLYPVVRFLQLRGIPKLLTIIFLMFLILGFIVLIALFFLPLLFEQSVYLIGLLITFLTDLSIKYHIDFEAIQIILDDSIDKLSFIATTGFLKVLNSSINYVTLLFIIVSTSFYFLIDFDKVHGLVKKKITNSRFFQYLYLINIEMRNYLDGFLKIGLISFFEYSLAFLVIGHPNFLLLGILSGLFGIIPYFGGMIACVIALVTASIISFDLFIKTFILFVVLSQVDGFIINPLIYGKTNRIHPILVIFSVFLGGSVFGIIGIIVSLPLMIIFLSTIRFFKYDISDIIVSIRDKEFI